jgi:hypothetical protein
MAQRLAHQMEVKIIGPWLQFWQQGGKFRRFHDPWAALCAGTESAA